MLLQVLGHVDGRCSFESVLLKYGLDDPALARMAQIVHCADIEADVHQTPEGAGLKAIAMGFRKRFGDRAKTTYRLVPNLVHTEPKTSPMQLKSQRLSELG